jgi:translation initiation factor IF-1
MSIVPLRVPVAQQQAVQWLGRVLECLDDGLYQIECEDNSTRNCPRAASCLLRPNPGDTVLLAGPDCYRVYLLAVIEQADAGRSQWDAPADLVLSARGSLAIEGQEVRLTTGLFRVIAHACETLADRLSAICRMSMRVTEQMDQTRASHIDQQAEQSLRLHSRHTMVTGKDLVKVDATQIHGG